MCTERTKSSRVADRRAEHARARCSRAGTGWLTDELVRLREATREYQDRVFATVYGDVKRNAAEAALDAEGEGRAVSFDLDQLAHRG